MTGESVDFESFHLTKSRLEALSDGIFAFAMTLLVIGVAMPDKDAIVQTEAYASQLLISLYSDFFHYVLAFLILGAFWLSHHITLHPVKALDRVYIWLNLATLLFVALLPFSTSFSGDFPKVPLGAVVFQLNLFIIGIGIYAQWKYASGRSYLVGADLDPRFVRHVGLRTLIIPILSLLGVGIALTGGHNSNMVYLLMPVIAILLRRHIAHDPHRF